MIVMMTLMAVTGIVPLGCLPFTRGHRKPGWIICGGMAIGMIAATLPWWHNLGALVAAPLFLIIAAFAGRLARFEKSKSRVAQHQSVSSFLMGIASLFWWVLTWRDYQQAPYAMSHSPMPMHDLRDMSDGATQFGVILVCAAVLVIYIGYSTAICISQGLHHRFRESQVVETVSMSIGGSLMGTMVLAMLI